MKIFRYVIIALGLALIIYNATILDFDNLLSGDSQVALIGMLAAACAILLVVILNISHGIKKKSKGR